jgi:hypothetical protein
MKILRWPALILANYRTGSSPLCQGVALENSVTAFVEPSITKERTDEFMKHYSSTSQYIVKFMPDQIDSFTPYQELLNSDCFKIKLTRKDKAAQIASYYIASVRDKWWTTKTEESKNYFVPIIHDKILHCITHIKQVDLMLESFENFDIELYYEDIGIIEDIDRVHSRKPANFEHLINIIKEQL